MRHDLLRSSPPLDLEIYLRKAAVQPATLDLDLNLCRTDARERLGLDPSERWAVFAGRLIEQKRPRTVLAAAALIPDLRVAVLGDGPLREMLEEEFPEVRFLGQTPRFTALTWLAAADLCLAASLLEGAPTTVREARALGTPVVARDSGDCAAWGRHDSELWIVS
jgi:glycosyltransferase involved in cell wall biosynthesis